MRLDEVYGPDWLPEGLRPRLRTLFDGRIRYGAHHNSKGREKVYRRIVATGTPILRTGLPFYGELVADYGLARFMGEGEIEVLARALDRDREEIETMWRPRSM